MRCAGFSLARSSTEGDEAGPTAGITAALTRSPVEPQCPKKPRAFWAVTAPSALPSASRVLASALRKSPLIFENVSSMGLRSGEYAGKKKARSPPPPPTREPSRPCEPKGCPSPRPVRARATVPGYARRTTRRSPSLRFSQPPHMGPSPPRSCSPATSCSCCGCAVLCRIARLPRRAHANSEESAVFEPISSTNTSRPVSISSQMSFR